MMITSLISICQLKGMSNADLQAAHEVACKLAEIKDAKDAEKTFQALKELQDQPYTPEAIAEGLKTYLQTNKYLSSWGNRYSMMFCRDRNRQTLLHLACDSGSTHLVKAIMMAAGDTLFEYLITQDGSDHLPIDNAIRNGYLEIVDIIIDAARNRAWKLICPKREFNNSTSLHLAALYGHNAIVTRLIAFARQTHHDIYDFISIVNNGNATALHNAALGGEAQICTMLIDEAKIAGKAVEFLDIKNWQGRTALDVALWRLKQLDDSEDDECTIQEERERLEKVIEEISNTRRCLGMPVN